MKKLTLFLGIFMLSSLLSACAGIFMPQHKTIEYDEEVKLHDGSMIWVHIKRHYHLTGGAIGDPGWGEPSYMPGAVEISWDTGFKGVGRKSVFFGKYVGIIDKYNGKWYLIGNKTNSSKEHLNNSINCDDIGVFKGLSRCIVTINQQGRFVKAVPDELYQINRKNIIYPLGIKDWGNIPKPLDGTKLSWNAKLNLQQTQSKRFSDLGKELLTGDK